MNRRALILSALCAPFAALLGKRDTLPMPERKEGRFYVWELPHDGADIRSGHWQKTFKAWDERVWAWYDTEDGWTSAPKP